MTRIVTADLLVPGDVGLMGGYVVLIVGTRREVPRGEGGELYTLSFPKSYDQREKGVKLVLFDPKRMRTWVQWVYAHATFTIMDENDLHEAV